MEPDVMTSARRIPGTIPAAGPATHIARVAARLFATRGYDATSVRMIVEAAGVTKPTLYYHFGSKEGLAHALLTRPLSDLLDRVRDLLLTRSDPRDALTSMLEAHFDFCRDDPDRARFVYAIYFGPLGGDLIGEAARLGEALAATFGDAARRCAELGLIAPDRACDLASACRGVVVIATVDFLYEDKPLTHDLAIRLVSNLFQGFAHDPSRT